MTRCYLFDLDGTLADCGHRIHHLEKEPKDWDAFFAGTEADPPIAHMLEVAKALEKVAPILFVTGRSESSRDATEIWLFRHGFGKGSNIYMRAAGDRRDDDVVKGELLDAILARGFKPIMAFEDRSRVVAMWRARGIPCAQVAPGDF